MPTVELGPLPALLGDTTAEDLITVISGALTDSLQQEENTPWVIDDDGAHNRIPCEFEDAMFSEFLDQLDANGLDCDIYLPIEFEDTLTAGDLSIGSCQSLLWTLDDLRSDFGVSSSGDDLDQVDSDGMLHEEDEEDFGGDTLDVTHMRGIWQTLMDAATSSIEQSLALRIQR